MKLPRDLKGTDLAKSLERLGYQISHQTGSHLRLTTWRDGEHHLTIPAHDPIRIGTLSAVLRDLSEHHHLSRDELLKKLFP